MTRQEYLNAYDGTDKAHRVYYGQFVNKTVKALVTNGIGLDALVASQDPHFNDIPLAVWDNVGIALQYRSGVRAQFQRLGDFVTPSGLVCILKEAARQIVEDHNRPTKRSTP